MNPIRINLEQLKNKTIPIGREGENEYTVVHIDCGKVFREHPQAEVSMKVKPPKGNTYPVTVEREGNEIVWTVHDYDLASKGDGQFQLTFTDGTVICKTAIGRTLVLKSLEGNGPAPTPIEDWMEEAQEALDAVEDAEVNQPVIGEDGYWYTWNQETGEYQKTDTKAEGQDGEDGHTPVLTSSKSGKTTTIYADGDQLAQIQDGQDANIDDTSTAADKVWSAAKSNTLLSAIQEKPETKTTDAQDGIFDIADHNGYVVARFKGGDIETKNFNSATDIVGFEYKFSGEDLLIAYGYNDENDAVVVLNEGRSNDLFDFSDLMLKPKDIPLSELETADLVTVWHSGTDMHGPFEFLVTSDADGYHSESTDPGWTGGVHTVTIDGNDIKTAKTKYLYFFADGKPVESGYGRVSHFEMRWANEVQAYNCVKADGTGRTSLIEYHDMIFDGVRFTEQIRIKPTEQIKMQLWYGLQGVGFNTTVYSSVSFIDGADRAIYDTTSGRNSGNAVTSGIKGMGQYHEVEIMVDTGTDLGKRTYYSSTEGAFSVTSTGKAYFNIIRKFGSNQVVMEANTNYFLNGSYRFFPAVQ